MPYITTVFNMKLFCCNIKLLNVKFPAVSKKSSATNSFFKVPWIKVQPGSKKFLLKLLK